ncbi:ABC transporter substrate-binding protein [Alkalihalobacterium bogoriense]|uniref:ABC transporter substrate-binding protein n=1 Tax=Alkalihalobacterium bogoriense TaxID=246272 RepID=UPI00047B6C78|nr:extracellular solute-binding protein [Alkalihalobacterium bogoriense]
MKKKGLKVVLLLMSMALLLFLAACGGESTNTDEETPNDSEKTEEQKEATKDPVQLRIVTMFGGTDPATDVLQAQLDAFEAENPHVTIVNESMTAGDEFRTKVNTDFTSNNAPDITFYFTGVDAQPIIDAGLVAPLNSLLEEDSAWKGSFSEAALEQMKTGDGNIYAIPLTGFYEALFVNEKLFEEQGLELPTTWDHFEAAIQGFADTDIVPLAGSYEESYYLVEHYILAAGGEPGYSKVLADNDPSWAEGLDMIGKHAEMGAFPVDAGTIDLPMAQNLFQQEQAAMMVEGSWAWGGIEEDVRENVTVLPFPVFGNDATYGDLVGGFSSGYYLSTNAMEDTAKAETAIALLKHLTSEQSVIEVAEANGGVPAAGTVSDIHPKLLAGHQLVANATSLTMPIDSRITPEAFTHMRTNVAQIVNGNKTGEKVVEEAAALE